jgi:hypothetical protein
MDISNFFPSLKEDKIFDVWKRFFNFPDSVAGLLTRITTFNGALPQGAPTSPGLANLAFWDVEDIVVNELTQNGFKYTRFVDDVTVSTTSYVPMQDLAPIFANIFDMFYKKGVKPNRNKIDISTKGHGMLVHNLNIDAGIPTIPNSERKRIRAAVKECETKFPGQSQSEEYERLWKSTIGRVAFMSQLHRDEAQTYNERLQAVKPTKPEDCLKSVD